ncbi:YqaJ domain-containing protein [Aphis craccivora]|uniref:YqaJ domain-containing protein n=1 Tax=Aphis craccivora TaxID=307492 RepID=A0A6G0YB00_APHCR|nr:YqaJ domain-containing protein [Aphis craccivora]
MDSLLPEIINSRFDRGLPIRPGIPEKKYYNSCNL